MNVFILILYLTADANISSYDVGIAKSVQHCHQLAKEALREHPEAIPKGTKPAIFCVETTKADAAKVPARPAPKEPLRPQSKSDSVTDL